MNVHGQIERIEPPNWWVGFEDNSLQLLVKGMNISSSKVVIEYEGVTILNIEKANSPNYLFINLEIAASTKASEFEIIFVSKKGKKNRQKYQLKRRDLKPDEFVGFDNTDAIYLITPDRFANGNPSNDIDLSLNEKIIDRSKDDARHGGDIQGITNHLDYIEKMGFTTIWPTPMLTNDMFETSYHGYAITDFYQVDPRFGTLDEYIQLSYEAKNRGIKLIMDQVANHCGFEHWWMKDLPFTDWVNYQNMFENGEDVPISNHRRTTNQDLYASQIDSKLMSDGWFTEKMPDLNQRNSYLAKYLIQNSIWWIETLQLGGIRQDTYPYSDKEFMARWAGSIMKEYPKFSIVGEEWSINPLLVGYWQTGIGNKDGYESNLRSSMDFPMQKGIVEALKENEEWDSGLVKIYEGLSNDFYYKSPKNILLFPDNHDMDRIHTQLDQNSILTKMALSYILTLPRIVQIYYGTEILLENSDKPGDHGRIRTDFPGGWAGDEINAFNGAGLSDDQLEMQSYLKILLNYRKQSDAIHRGNTIHFSPEKGVYVLFRKSNTETVVHILNKNENAVDLDLSRFAEIGLDGSNVKNIITGESFIWNDTLKLETMGSVVLTTKLD